MLGDRPGDDETVSVPGRGDKLNAKSAQVKDEALKDYFALFFANYLSEKKDAKVSSTHQGNLFP